MQTSQNQKRFIPQTRSKAKTEDAAEPDYQKYLNCEKTKARQDYGSKQDYGDLTRL